MDILNERQLKKLKDEHSNYVNKRNNFINILINHCDKEKDYYKINQFAFNNCIENKLLDYYGYEVIKIINHEVYIKEIDTNNRIKNIFDKIKMDNQIFIITFELINQYMTILSFIEYFQRYSKKYLNMDIKYNSKLLQINIV
jgi:hypothetical protein